MRVLRTVLLSLAALLAVFLLVGLFLPTTAHVERSIIARASPAAVYEVVSDLRRFNEWSPWFDLDPQAVYTYSGPERGVGAKLAWTSEQRSVGSGSQEIIAAVPDRSVTMRLDFGSEGRATARLEITPVDGGSRVTWGFDTDFAGSYLCRYFGLLLDRLVGADYEDGLARLKRLLEAAPGTG